MIAGTTALPDWRRRYLGSTSNFNEAEHYLDANQDDWVVILAGENSGKVRRIKSAAVVAVVSGGLGSFDEVSRAAAADKAGDGAGGFGPEGAEETGTEVVGIGDTGTAAGQMARDGEVQQGLEKALARGKE